MAWILGNPKFQAIYNDAAVNGGTLYFYEPGTTTGKSAYPTIADAAAETNGFTSKLLDAQGQPTTTDMFVMNGSYKLVLKDSAAATLWTVDNVEGQDDIFDVNGKELIKFTAIASAVNEFTITNAATASGPILSATGGDTDIDINFQAKGAGEYNFKSTSSQSAEIRLFEDTDNGTNYIGYKPPAALTASTTFTEPDGDGAANTFKLTNGSGTLAWSTMTGVVATQAEMETATSTTAAVTPGRAQYHPGVAKAWVYFTNAGTPTISVSHNVSSLTDTSLGVITVNYTTAFTTNHVGVGNCVRAGTGASSVNLLQFVTISTTSDVIATYSVATGSGANAEVDCTASWVAFGDQ